MENKKKDQIKYTPRADFRDEFMIVKEKYYPGDEGWADFTNMCVWFFLKTKPKTQDRVADAYPKRKRPDVDLNF